MHTNADTVTATDTDTEREREIKIDWATRTRIRIRIRKFLAVMSGRKCGKMATRAGEYDCSSI